MSTCPVLRRGEGGYICGYTNKPIDPFSWYCILNYGECPIYIRYSKERLPAAELAKTEARPLVETVAPVAGRPEAEFERAIKPVVDNVVLKYDEVVKKLDGVWREYENDVVNTKRRWEVEKLSLVRVQQLLDKTIGDYERALRELELKRALMSPDSYDSLRRELEERLAALRGLLEEVQSKYKALEEGLGAHFKRVLSTSTSAEVISLRLSLTRLEELLREGKISKETYERLKKELEEWGR